MEKKSHFSNFLVLFIAAILTVSIVAVGLILLNKSLENPTPVPPSGKVMTSSKNVSGTMVLFYEQDGQ